MASIDVEAPAATRAKQRWIAGVAVAVVACAVLVWANLARTPQMGADDETFRTVDALFTAVTARKENLLEDCAQRLAILKAQGKMPDGASAYLDRVVAAARSGAWQNAAEELYDFMMAQRRER